MGGFGLFVGLVLSYPMAAGIFALAIVGIVALIIYSAGAKKRALRQSQEKMIEEFRNQEAERQSLVRQRYEPDVAEKILKREFWQGMTSEQLRDSVGKPDAVATTVTKRAHKEVWKYEIYDTSITLENGVVVGWRQK